MERSCVNIQRTDGLLPENDHPEKKKYIARLDPYRNLYRFKKGISAISHLVWNPYAWRRRVWLGRNSCSSLGRRNTNPPTPRGQRHLGVVVKLW